MMSSRVVSWYLCLLAVGGSVAGGCGDGDGAADGGDGAVFDCATYAGAMCALMQRCAPLLDVASFNGDAAACRTRILSQCMPFESRIDAARGNTCVATLQSLACDDVLLTFPGMEIAPPPACTTMGTGKIGDRCADDMVCESGRCSRAFASTTCGTCQPTAGQGEPCADLADCKPGLSCFQGIQGMLCVKPAALGEACSDGVPCVRRGSCVQGTCARHALKGKPCDESGRTAPPCDSLQGLVCSANTCVEATFAATGQPCQSTSGCRGSYCTKAMSCAPLPGDGASCADARDPLLNCQYGALCYNLDKTCQPLHSPTCQ